MLRYDLFLKVCFKLFGGEDIFGDACVGGGYVVRRRCKGSWGGGD